ncbi:dTDP-4-dehydrorhamnose 3,5-epimerase family protein, partial [Cronobacter sakazakii]
AHGFIALQEGTEILYKTNNYYAKDYEQSIRWDDETIAIDWPMLPMGLSEKDMQAPSFANAKIFEMKP